MAKQFDPNSLQFFITLPAPCPYLDGLEERKIFTPLDPLSTPYINDYLTHSGFRRSQNVIYRPACEGCNACKSLRVLVRDFKAGKTFKRILSKNKHLKRTISEALATREQYKLLKEYLHTRHPKGGMNDMNFERYELMVEDCAYEAEIVEYRTADNQLIACAIIDRLSDGLSMVYSFFDPYMAKNGLGNFMVLDHIKRVQELGQDYLYLGYWVENSRKMKYKSRYRPFEILGEAGWQRYNKNKGK